MLGKYPYNVSWGPWCFVEKTGRDTLDRISEGKKLRKPDAVVGAFHSREVVQRNIADLTLHDPLVVQHGKSESQPFRIVSRDLVTD
jgi:hypothetical protein